MIVHFSAHISKWELVCKFGVIFHIFIFCLCSRFHVRNQWFFYSVITFSYIKCFVHSYTVDVVFTLSYEWACASLHTHHTLAQAYSYYGYICTNTMHLLFSFCTPSCYATLISEWEMGPIYFSEFPPILTLRILNCILNCCLSSARYIFHLVLCCDMFLCGVNKHLFDLTWLDLNPDAHWYITGS